MFQFPSNGKDFPNEKFQCQAILKLKRVSIPFKREGLSELNDEGVDTNLHGPPEKVSIPFKREGLSEQKKMQLLHTRMSLVVMFQFPSNGKDFPNVSMILKRQLPSARTQSFNSLQTGRTFRTQRTMHNSKSANVPFQFPSNGKDFPNSIIKSAVVTNDPSISVSIPFKREGLSERQLNRRKKNNGLAMFQFPSNGKDFPNKRHS